MKYISLFILLFALFPSVSQATEEDYFEKAEKHHQKFIEECKSESQAKWDTGVTATMQEGTYDYIQCLKDEIERIADVYYVDPREDHNAEALIKNLDNYIKDAFILYQHVHYGPCSPCGTQHIPIRVMDVASMVERVLKDMLIYAYEYDRPIEPSSPP